MRKKLYSELRTFYEMTQADPHTFRLTLKMKDLVDGRLLRRAVDQTMKRYPYFCVRLRREGDDPCFEEVSDPVPVLHTEERTELGGGSVSGHLICFCYLHNRIHIDVWHGLTDGGGIAPLLKTLLYYYCSGFYGTKLSEDGVRLCGGVPQQAEWDDPALRPLDKKRAGLAAPWNKPAFQVADGGIARLTPDCVSYNLRVPEKTFMNFNFSNDGSPATIVSLLLARAIDGLHPDAALPPVIAMCLNQRKALRAPLAHQSLVGDVRLPYAGRIKALPFSVQTTCFRGMVTLQSDPDAVLDQIRDYQDLAAQLETLPDYAARRVCCAKRMEKLSRCMTAVVSYVGKADFGEAERFIHECSAYPSTALPSVHVPLTIEMSVVNGNFMLNFLQFFREEDYISAFVSQLRRNGLDYEITEVTEARYPSVCAGLF